MNIAILLGVALGCGLLLIASSIVPARPSLAAALARLHEPRAGRTDSTNDDSLMVRLIGRPAAHTAFATHWLTRLHSDLRVAAMTGEELIARQALCALVGLLWAPTTVALMSLGGVSVPVVLPVWCSLFLAIVGALVPYFSLKVTAADRRRAFRHALSCYLDLVSVRLAGGAGIESALNASAQAGEGWMFVEIRQALAEARFMGEAPWSGLDRLGTDLGIAELNELAASVTLAGDEGARVRTSIAAKARSIRTRGLADAEGAAQAASERMSLPIVLLMLGFVVFLGYPAVTQVLTGL